MSLINDALKRAKQTQQENPPPTPPLEFRPVEPGQEERPRFPLLLVGLALGLTMIVALGALMLWMIAQNPDGGLQAEARSTATTEPAPAAIPADPPLAPLSAETASTSSNSPEEAMTNSLPAATVEPPAPEFKLQGIFYNPRNPSAVVNGRTVYTGDRVNGFRVLTITPEAVTLGNQTQTNVLSLSD